LFNLRWLDGRPMAPEETPVVLALQGKVGHDDEILVQSGDDDIIVSASTAPLLAEDGSIDGAVVVFRDITAQKRHFAVRDEFLAVAAHELRAPLAAIKGYSDLLVKREVQRADATERDRKGIMMLSAQIDHLVRLVDNLLDVSRIDTGRLELYLQAVDLINLVEVCIDRISVSNINHNIIFHGPPTLEILGDQLRLQQVFTNLLANAVRYSAPGTDIHVDVWTETCVAEDGESSNNDGAETFVVVAVRDQGVGIPPDAQNQVFERYFRANTSLAASGLGLGLYLCREIVNRHGGRISLESTPGQGTTFYVALPPNLQRRSHPAIADV
jgi:two-component system phosphate regulon sensor histidine kinase PhoR